MNSFALFSITYKRVGLYTVYRICIQIAPQQRGGGGRPSPRPPFSYAPVCGGGGVGGGGGGGGGMCGYVWVYVWVGGCVGGWVCGWVGVGGCLHGFVAMIIH